MNEREELLVKFEKSIPLVNEFGSLENKSDKCTKTKDRLAKIIVVIAAIVILYIPYCIFSGEIGGLLSGIPFYILLAVMIYLSKANKKKLSENEAAINKIINSDEFSFVPFSYRNPVDMVGIYMVLVDMRADTFKEAINTWEQDKHNMKMEAKPTVIVK